MQNCIIAGSFDPIQRGHIWLIQEACHFMENVNVLIANAPGKKPTFSKEKRKHLIEASLKTELNEKDFSKISVHTLNDKDMLVHFAMDNNIRYIVRGLRDMMDFNYEMGVQAAYRKLSKGAVEIIFLSTPKEYCEVSSSIIKSMVGLRDWKMNVKDYTTDVVIEALASKLENK